MEGKNNENYTCAGKCYSWSGRHSGLVSALLIMLVIFVGAKAFAEIKGLPFVGSGKTPSATIQVTGMGEKFAKPDIAEFSFTVESEASTVQKAQTTVTDLTAKAKDFLNKNGVEDKDIKTTNYSIYPRYEYRAASQVLCTEFGCPSGQTRVLAGYDVAQSFTIKVRDIEETGTLLGGLGELGITNLGGVTFSIDEEDDLLAEARAEAIDKAREKAKVLARDLGVDLVRVVSFQEGGSYTPYPVMYAALDSATGGKASPEIPTGETTISSSVTIIYEIN